VPLWGGDSEVGLRVGRARKHGRVKVAGAEDEPPLTVVGE
jgi:hypothetical protein